MSNPATKEDLQELFMNFAASQSKLIDDKIAEASASFDVKIKSISSAKLVWKREGHKRQFNFNQSILDQIAVVERINESDIVQTELDKVKEIIDHRQKLIRLADTSPSGWATVEEYETNELANDSDDDRRISRAEARAARKVKAAAKVSNAKRFRRDYQPAASFSAPPPSSATASSTTSFQQQLFRAQRYPSSRDICFACGCSGHWRRSCPNVGKRQENRSAAGSSSST